MELNDRLKRNLGLGVVYRALAKPFLIVPLAAAAAGVRFWTRDSRFSGPIGLVFDVLLLDLASYALHVACHHSKLLWKFHSVHHMDKSLDATTGLRVHFGEKLLTIAAKAALMIATAMPLSHFAVAEVVSLVFALFHHSRVPVSPRLERVLNRAVTTPGFHGVHHLARRPYTDANYGFVFSFWDDLFGTAIRRAAPAGMGYGLDDHDDAPLSRLLFNPLRLRAPYEAA